MSGIEQTKKIDELTKKLSALKATKAKNDNDMRVARQQLYDIFRTAQLETEIANLSTEIDNPTGVLIQHQNKIIGSTNISEPFYVEIVSYEPQYIAFNIAHRTINEKLDFSLHNLYNEFKSRWQSNPSPPYARLLPDEPDERVLTFIINDTLELKFTKP